jgi:hypothetical protein
MINCGVVHLVTKGNGENGGDSKATNSERRCFAELLLHGKQLFADGQNLLNVLFEKFHVVHASCIPSHRNMSRARGESTRAHFITTYRPETPAERAALYRAQVAG